MQGVTGDIESAVRQVATDRGLVLAALRPEAALVDELGLRSLDLARIVAILQLRLGVDPFASLVPFTSVRTLGDLQRAFELGLSGAAPAAAADPGQDRARARLAARAAHG